MRTHTNEDWTVIPQRRTKTEKVEQRTALHYRLILAAASTAEVPYRTEAISIKTINLKAGMPTVSEALQHLDRELGRARQAGCGVLKLVHGYGSTGAGGEIRIAAQRRLMEMASRGEIRACIFGESWAKSDEQAWALINARPELRQDHDLGRRNHGITIVVL